VVGVTTLSCTRLDPTESVLSLDAVDLDATEIRVSGASVPIVRTDDGFAVPLPAHSDPFSVRIAYRATPNRGMYFIAKDDVRTELVPHVWTQCQERDARHFFPCVDHPHEKSTYEVLVTVPRGLRVLSNGELVEHVVGEAEETFHWFMRDPIPSYLLAIVAGTFEVVEEKVNVGGRDVPLSYWVLPGMAADVPRTFGRTAAMMKLFSERTSVPYPFAKYAQAVVQDCFFGGMENTTATVLYEHTMLSERAALDITSDDLIAHELAHHWFGDLLTCRDWSEAWLNEGFATYMEHVWDEAHLGRDEYELGLMRDLAAYLAESSSRYVRPVVHRSYEAPIELFDRHLYEKGSLVLHVLRETVGTEVFWRAVGSYLRRHAHGSVETRDLVRELEDASGKSLGELVDALLYAPGHPVVTVSVSHRKGWLIVTARQEQDAAEGVREAFSFPLEVWVQAEDGPSTTHVLRVQSRLEQFAIPMAERPTALAVDPRLLIVGDLKVRMACDLAQASATTAPTARGRALALSALDGRLDPKTRALLVAIVSNEREHWGVRAQAARILGSQANEEACAALVELLSVAHPKVRRAVAYGLGETRRAEAVGALARVARGDVSYLVQAEAVRGLGKSREAAAFEVVTELLDRPSWGEVLRASAMDALAGIGDERGLEFVVAMSRLGKPTRARRAAASALPKLGSVRRSRELLTTMLADKDPNLRWDAAAALSEMGDGEARKALETALAREVDGRVRRRIREGLRDLAERQPSRALQQELESVKHQHALLRAKVAKLEAGLAAVMDARTNAPRPSATRRPKKGKPS
jgi:aminopeptidase N